MSIYQVKSLSTNSKIAWNKFISHHPYNSPLQLWEWGEVKTSVVWQPIHLGVFYRKKLVAGAQILKRTLPFGLSKLYCPRGPVLNWQDPKAPTILKNLLEYIKEKYSSSRTLFCRIEPQIDSSYQLSVTGPLSLHPYFKSIQPSHTSIIDLTQKLEDLIYHMDKDTRYGIRRAAREGVRVIKDQGKNKELWKIFYEKYQQTAEKGFSPRSWRQFEKVFQLMAPSKQAELYLSFLPPQIKRQQSELPSVLVDSFPAGSRVIAAAAILKTQNMGCYLWGASDISPETKNLYAPYILQWEIMQSLKRENVKEYDLWGIAPTDNPKHAWSGHTLFKKGFSGKRVSYIGCLDLPLSPLYYFYRGIDYTRQKIFQPDLIEENTR